jgi:mono/diheme cytochrome c family protein
MTSRTALVAGIFLAALTAQSPAQVVAGDPASGRLLVEARCSSCHAMEEVGHPAAPAPGFAAIAGMPSTTSLSLRVFLVTPHPSMPNYRLTDVEVDDVIAWIIGLKRR